MSTPSSSLVFLHYLTTVFDNLDEAIMLVGIEPHETYRLLLANQAFPRITGHMAGVVGRLVSDFVDPETYQILRKQYKQVTITKQPTSFTDTYIVPMGQESYNVKLIPILNSVGEVVQIAIITQNVTEAHRLREENRTLRQQLKKTQQPKR